MRHNKICSAVLNTYWAICRDKVTNTLKINNLVKVKNLVLLKLDFKWHAETCFKLGLAKLSLDKLGLLKQV